MILIKNLILILIGVSSGLMVSAGVFAFITMIGVINRLLSRTKTAGDISWYENLIILGGSLGNACIVFETRLPVSSIGLAIFGLCAGVFVGCLSMALAEMLMVIPIFSMRIKLKVGIPIVVASIALGKAFGAFIQLYWYR